MASAPGSESKKWPLWILLLMAVGGPVVGAGFAFAEEVTQHPLKAAGLALLYFVGVFVVGFVGKVWQRLEPQLTDSVAQWADARVRGIFSHYRKRYLEHLVYRHRDFDVKGLTTQGTFTLELERVFVELTVAPQPAHRASTAPVRAVPEELREGRHAIWDYLRSEPLVEQNLAVIGPPGCGKTTLLKHMALTLTAPRKKRKGVKAPDKLPVLLFLRDHGKTIQENPELSLAEAVRDDLARRRGPEAPRGWFARQLERGRCLVMLDGLDEVADPEARKQVAAWVEREMTAWGKNRFVVSSRPHGYRSNPLGKVTVLEVMSFSRGQVERFVENWYLANEIMSAQKDDPGVRMKAREGAEDLLGKIRNTASLSALAVNPLLLTMIANVHRFRSSLPGRRVELYAEICEVFLGKRQEAKGLEADLTPAQKRLVLQLLAYGMMCGRSREIEADEAVEAIRAVLAGVSPGTSGEAFLKMIENTSGVLVERESGVYGFGHLTFQEYLAAVHVQEEGEGSALAERVGDSWWHETIRLYGAQGDATEIIRACLAGEPPAAAALTLAIECLGEARKVQPEVRAELEAVLNEGVEDPDPDRRRIVAGALLALRLHRMVRMSEDVYVDPGLITHAEYQLFLDERQAEGKYHQPDHWRGVEFAEGAGREPVVGVRPSDAVAFCEWLTEREGGAWRYRVPSIGEVGRSGAGGGVEGKVGARFWCWCSEATVGYWRICGPRCELPVGFLDRQIGEDVAARGSFVQALVRDRADALARDLTRASDLGDDLEGELAGATDLTLRLARARDLDPVSIFDLRRALRRAVDVAGKLDRAVNLARALVNVIDLAHANDLASELVGDLDGASGLALHLDGAVELAHDLVSVSHLPSSGEIARDLARVLEHARTSALHRDCALASADVLERAHALASDLTSASDVARAFSTGSVVSSALLCGLVREFADEFGHHLLCDTRINLDWATRYGAMQQEGALATAVANALDRDLDRRVSGGECIDVARWALRVSLLELLRKWLPAPSYPRSLVEKLLPGARRWAKWHRFDVMTPVSLWLDLYRDLAILEARGHGEVPASEGIRIVRERGKEEAETPSSKGQGE